MTVELVQYGVFDIFHQILSVASMQMNENQMTLPVGLEELVQVDLGYGEEWEAWNPVLVLKLGDKSIYKIQVCKTK